MSFDYLAQNQGSEFESEFSAISHFDNAIGMFQGYLKRAEPSAKGVNVKIMGYNGLDADKILALSMSKFMDMHVTIEVYWIQDSSGAIQKKDGHFPLIACFDGFINRSIPKQTGMIASFFVANGDSCDKAHDLGYSKYIDTMVNVAIFPFKQDHCPPNQSKFEDVIFPARDSKSLFSGDYMDFAKLMAQGNVFSQPEFWESIGGETSYIKWLENRPCSISGCNHSAMPVLSDFGSFEAYNYTCLCPEHAAQAKREGIKMRAVLDEKRKTLTSQWAQEQFSSIMGETSIGSVPPWKVLSFFNEKRLYHLASPKMLKFLSGNLGKK